MPSANHIISVRRNYI